MTVKTFAQLKKVQKNSMVGQKEVRLVLLGDTGTQFLSQALSGTGLEQGLDLQIWEADFNQI